MIKKIIAKLKLDSFKIKTSDKVTTKSIEKKKSIQVEKQMKYRCKNCDFVWEGTVDTFDKVRIHDKTHEKNKILDQNSREFNQNRLSIFRHTKLNSKYIIKL